MTEEAGRRYSTPECSEHGAQTVQVPWAEGSSRFTLFFESFALEVLKACPAMRARELRV